MVDTEELQSQIIAETYGTYFAEEVDEYDYDSEYDSSIYELSAQEQWEESLKQISGLVNFIIFPLIGKFLGRKASHIIWRRLAEWWYI